MAYPLATKSDNHGGRRKLAPICCLLVSIHVYTCTASQPGCCHLWSIFIEGILSLIGFGRPTTPDLLLLRTVLWQLIRSSPLILRAPLSQQIIRPGAGPRIHTQKCKGKSPPSGEYRCYSSQNILTDASPPPHTHIHDDFYIFIKNALYLHFFTISYMYIMYLVHFYSNYPLILPEPFFPTNPPIFIFCVLLVCVPPTEFN